jgi:hypothetical protein
MLDRLSPEFANLTLYSYENHPNCPWTSTSEEVFRKRWPGVELVIERHTKTLRYITRAKNLLASLFPAAAGRFLRMSLANATPKLEALKNSSNFFIVSYAEGLAQLNGVDPSQCFIETHDVNFVKWAKLHHKSPVSLVPLRKLRGEMAVLETARGVISISPTETSFFKMMLKSPTVAYVPSWDPPKTEDESNHQGYDFDFVFAGSEYIMNVRGLVSLLEEHGQWLANYRVAVCGKVCDDPCRNCRCGALPQRQAAGICRPGRRHLRAQQSGPGAGRRDGPEDQGRKRAGCRLAGVCVGALPGRLAGRLRGSGLRNRRGTGGRGLEGFGAASKGEIRRKPIRRAS